MQNGAINAAGSDTSTSTTAAWRVGAGGETGLRTGTLVQQLFQMPTSTYTAVICSLDPMS